MKKIIIADSTLSRENASFSFKEKIEIARQLEKLHVDVIEIPEIKNVKSDTLLVKTIASFVKKSVLSVATGITAQDVENAAAAVASAKNARLKIELPMSPVGMEYTCHIKPAKMLELIPQLVNLAKTKCASVEFCAVDATRAEKDFLREAIFAAVSAGAEIVTICDNAAESMPDAFAAFVAEVKSWLGEGASLGVSCDDKNGLASGCAVLAVGAGADIVKTCVEGDITSLEGFAGMIKNCGNSCGFESNIKYTELNRIIKQISWVNANAKNAKSSVTVADDDDLSLRLDANDDKEAVNAAAIKLGYDLSDSDSDKVYEEFLRVVAKKNVGAKELEAIIASVALQVEPTYKLISYVLNSGNIISATAQIKLKKGDSEIDGICIGDGPIDAAFLAIEQIIGHHYELDDFQIQSVTEGKEAMASALVKLRNDGKLYSGNGISTDIIGAGIRAYINAVNKIVYEEAN
ncbi:MAG: hypothetical protein IKD04_09850 [Clostridia bacterium]|nr:hypothetical protein [Clostridia bacterium]